MKKSLLLSILTLSVLGMTAQITLTSADIASPTKAIRQAHDTMPTVSIGSAGASQAWNMLALNNHFEDTLVFLPNSSSPPQFTSANIALKFGFQNAYAYLSNTASAATILGSAAVVDFGGGPSQIVVVNTPAEKLANWPATYNSNFTNVYSTKSKYYFGVDPGIGVAIDSIRTHGKVNKTVVFDAWGMIATPLGTYSVLRVKTTTVQRDSTDAYITLLGGWQDNVATSADSSASYTWWANGIGFPLVEIKMDSLGITEATWLQALPMTVGINEYTTAVDMNVYPNPAQDEVNFMVDSNIAKSMVIYDITGRKIDSFMITSDLSTINTSTYANGSYTYSVVGQDNTILARGKFSVAK
jgi:hypothetical protein